MCGPPGTTLFIAEWSWYSAVVSEEAEPLLPDCYTALSSAPQHSVPLFFLTHQLETIKATHSCQDAIIVGDLNQYLVNSLHGADSSSRAH
ncbi:hypothetical protein E2C01_009819 [Portunus trituberculatus]|uniref:Uncharacterized protein n=1 Tax=Portunus trituberculatus TaxID=210409 RepID=A0A5B7D6S9_PORTR|nr:hypothetical protein [Portunus trituberculatus]